jgi:uncharacterized protein
MSGSTCATWVLSGLVLAVLGACGPKPTPPPAFDEASWRAELATWRQERDAGLRREDGWLSLVGLDWLHEGDNVLGSGDAAEVKLPAGKAPARAGILRRAGEMVTLLAEAGSGLTVEGQPVTETMLTADAAGKPVFVELGSLSFFVIQRGDRVGVRIRDREAAVLRTFTGIESFAEAPGWRIAARFEPYDPPRTLKIPNVLGQVSEEPCPGALVFELGGQTLRLEPTGSPDQEMSLVFGDATNGHETYGGGRFLETSPVGLDGRVILDFNRAYNPPCVFTPYATCPLPPRSNRLPVRIEAGEKMYGEAHDVPEPVV